MPGAGRRHGIIGRRHAFAQVAARIVGAVMLDAPAFDPAPQVGRQCLAGRLHAAEPGVAAAFRDLQRIEHGGVGRRVEIAHVGVPDRLAGAQRADRIALGVEHVGHDVDVGIAGRADAAALLVGRRVELAEAPAEGQEVVSPSCWPRSRIIECRSTRARSPRSPVAQPSQIDAGNLRAHRLGHRTHRHGHVASSVLRRDDRPASAADQAPPQAPSNCFIQLVSLAAAAARPVRRNRHRSATAPP